MNMEASKLALLCMQRHSWEQGVTAQAFLELGDFPAVLALCKEAAYRCLPDGRVAIMDDVNAVTDPCAMGEALLWAAQATGDPDLTAALEHLTRWALRDAPRNGDGIVYHVMNAPQMWVDSCYMLPPFLAAIGEADEAMKQLDGYEARLLDPSTGLMCHQWDDGAGRFVRAAHWGVGNGWALAAYARLIRCLPHQRETLAGRAIRLIDALLPWMREDGLFHDVVDDASTFVEGNLSQMLCYTLVRGLREGWLPETYTSAAHRLHEAALARVDAYGIVRGVCGAPTFDKSGVAPEAQAFLLMMQHEWSLWKEEKEHASLSSL